MDNRWYQDSSGEEHNAAHIHDEGEGDAAHSAHTEAAADVPENDEDDKVKEHNPIANQEDSSFDKLDLYAEEASAPEGAQHTAMYEAVPDLRRNGESAQPRKKEKKRKSTVKYTTFVACLMIMVVLGGLLGGGLVYLMQTGPSPDAGLVEGNNKNDGDAEKGDDGNDYLVKDKASSGLKLASNQSAPATSREEAVARTISSIVGIDVSAEPNMLGETKTGSGSGVIITADGYIVTNNHVVNGASKITVYLQDGSEHEAKLIGTDTQSDLAVIKIEANSLPAATLGESSTLRVGQEVIAIGNPLGDLMSTVTNGIISALDRTITVEGQEMTLLQTNAAINPGNSGGGLFDMNGNLIGVVNAKSMGFEVEGLGFAIPIDVAKMVVADLIDQGYVSGRPYLGVGVQDVTYAHGDQSGGHFNPFSSGQYTTRVQVMNIVEGGPAAKGGMQLNDLILSVNGTEITGSSQFTSMFSEYNAGDVVTITVQRGNNTVELSITLGERTA